MWRRPRGALHLDGVRRLRRRLWGREDGGLAVAASVADLLHGDPGLAILGLPLMNSYFTIFDGEADGGKVVVKFATAKG